MMECFKKNTEGYADPTPYEAMLRIAERDRRERQRRRANERVTFVYQSSTETVRMYCSPFPPGRVKEGVQ